MGILNQIKLVTGISRNQLAEIFDVSTSQVATWEVDESTIPVATLAFLVSDFERATEWLDDDELTWDQVVTYRYAAMRLGVSSHILGLMLHRHEIIPFDFGRLGRWITTEELGKCRKQ